MCLNIQPQQLQYPQEFATTRLQHSSKQTSFNNGLCQQNENFLFSRPQSLQSSLSSLISSIVNSVMRSIEQMVGRIVDSIMGTGTGATDLGSVANTAASQGSPYTNSSGDVPANGVLQQPGLSFGKVIDSLLSSLTNLAEVGRGFFGKGEAKEGGLFSGIGKLFSSVFSGGTGLFRGAAEFAIDKGGDLLSKGFGLVKRWFGF